MSAIPLVIDTDPGIDDAFAIMAAIAEPRVDLLGLTTVFGNVPVATATRNAQHLVALAGATVPVARGAAEPLVQAPPPHPDFVHGKGGLGSLDVPDRGAPDPRDAAAFIAEMAGAHTGQLTLLAVGPLTNLAAVVEHHASAVDKIARVVVMGGSLHHRGNVSPRAEANFWQDPHAAARVLAADWPVTVVGLDVTETVRLYPEDVALLPNAAPRCGTLLAGAFAHYADFHRESRGFHGCYLHDPAALVAVTDPDRFETWRAKVEVDTGDERPGALIETTTGRELAVCMSADGPGIRRILLDNLMSGRLP